MTTTAEVSVMKLTAADRCDRCGAQAYVRTRHGDLSLLWCCHHANAAGEKLTPAIVTDERPKAPEPA